MTLNEILEEMPDEQFLLADGFDESVIGYEPNTMKLVYDIDKMVSTLVAQGMTNDDAWEYLEFNTFCAYVGEKTPIYIRVS